MSRFESGSPAVRLRIVGTFERLAADKPTARHVKALRRWGYGAGFHGPGRHVYRLVTS